MFLRLILALVVVLSVSPAWADQTWRVTKPEWTADDERGYSAFVQRIGESSCETPDDCINSDANPYRGTDGRGISFNADCADLVYMLRAYYAWKNGLPFGFVNMVEAREPMGEGDLRATLKGNIPVSRWDVTVQRPGADIRGVLQTIRDQVSTATFRVDP